MVYRSETVSVPNGFPIHDDYMSVTYPLSGDLLGSSSCSSSALPKRTIVKVVSGSEIDIAKLVVELRFQQVVHLIVLTELRCPVRVGLDAAASGRVRALPFSRFAARSLLYACHCPPCGQERSPLRTVQGGLRVPQEHI